jgi:hypothetical protein
METEELLARLGVMVDWLREIARALPRAQMAQRAGSGPFSFVEHACHLADLEAEGYGVRIHRLLSEAQPQLADFDGDRVARERRYGEQDPLAALDRFAAARAENLTRLRDATAENWANGGTQEGVGMVTLADIPRLMLAHDRSHADEIVSLLTALAATPPALLSGRP